MHQVKSDRDKQKAYFGIVEKEIYNYHNTKRRLDDLRDAIIDEGWMQEIPSGGRISDTTANKAVRLVSSTSLYQMERVVNAIDKALRQIDQLEPARKELVRLKYWDRRLTDLGIWKRLNISRSTFYRWRAQFVYSVAEELGWDAGQGGK